MTLLQTPHPRLIINHQSETHKGLDGDQKKYILRISISSSLLHLWDLGILGNELYRSKSGVLVVQFNKMSMNFIYITGLKFRMACHKILIVTFRCLRGQLCMIGSFILFRLKSLQVDVKVVVLYMHNNCTIVKPD